MNVRMIADRFGAGAGARTETRRGAIARRRTWPALAGVLGLATMLNFYQLSRDGQGNT